MVRRRLPRCDGPARVAVGVTLRIEVDHFRYSSESSLHHLAANGRYNALHPIEEAEIVEVASRMERRRVNASFFFRLAHLLKPHQQPQRRLQRSPHVRNLDQISYAKTR